LLGDAKSSLGDAKSSLGDAKSLLGDAKSSLGDAKSSLGDAKLRACWATCSEPIRSKDAVVVSVGFRTFSGQPIYSVDAHNMDKHKVERFLHPGAMMMASFYAPITFPPAPVLAFRPETSGRWEQLLWSGSVRLRLVPPRKRAPSTLLRSAGSQGPSNHGLL
jgi:hypothetical protein